MTADTRCDILDGHPLYHWPVGHVLFEGEYHQLPCPGKFKSVGYYETRHGQVIRHYRCQCCEVSISEDIGVKP